MAAPLIHVDGALTICARAHSLNTAGPTLAGSGLSGLEQALWKSGRRVRQHKPPLQPLSVGPQRAAKPHLRRD